KVPGCSLLVLSEERKEKKNKKERGDNVEVEDRRRRTRESMASYFEQSHWKTCLGVRSQFHPCIFFSEADAP
ncbi:MAG: hypothetical protein Q8736_02575, partial [Sweet potato little leaf phytoplasma]|nr:hypothetical protein [Sweet potato little leaf phytoplasma]